MTNYLKIPHFMCQIRQRKRACPFGTINQRVMKIRKCNRADPGYTEKPGAAKLKFYEKKKFTAPN